MFFLLKPNYPRNVFVELYFALLEAGLCPFEVLLHFDKEGLIDFGEEDREQRPFLFVFDFVSPKEAVFFDSDAVYLLSDAVEVVNIH